ncbi:hypothetical protein ACFL0O_00380 [Thermodesulfobacteriota bacterium]
MSETFKTKTIKDISQQFFIMYNEILNFPLPKYYNLFMTCHVHGWKNLAPFRWDDESNKLHFSVFIDDCPVDVVASQEPNSVKAFLNSHKKFQKSQLNKAADLISRTLSLNTSTNDLIRIAERVGPEYVKIIKMGAGRLLHASTLWEDAAKTLFTTNCSWSLTTKMCEAVCSETFSSAAPSGAYPFPPPQKIAEHTTEQMQDLMPIGYRSEYLIALAKCFSEDPFLSNIESNGFSYKEADTLVRELRGFGDYAVAHLLILNGYFDEVPIDTVVVSYLKSNYRVRKPQSFIDRTYRKWKEYKWWGFKLEKMLNRQNWLGD